MGACYPDMHEARKDLRGIYGRGTVLGSWELGVVVVFASSALCKRTKRNRSKRRKEEDNERKERKKRKANKSKQKSQFM